jgi:riboflavin synthase
VFTGIVEELGAVLERSAGPAGSARLRVAARLVTVDARVGDSIAVNGCCLTVEEVGDGWFAATAVAETLSLTNLGRLAVGAPVNLERPLRLADRLGGHLVQGHVDGLGRVVRAAPDLRMEMDASLGPYVVAKGSIAVDGCSLTVVQPDATSFGVAVIPHTAEATTLGRLRPGDLVNLEVDLVAKYVERLLRGAPGGPSEAAGPYHAG